MKRQLIIGLALILSLKQISFGQNLVQNDSLYEIQDSVLIPTKSGVNIVASIVRKKDNLEPLPVVLFYTTYYQGKSDIILGTRSAERDYIGIVAYDRGIRSNLNHYAPYENEGKDVFDIIVG